MKKLGLICITILLGMGLSACENDSNSHSTTKDSHSASSSSSNKVAKVLGVSADYLLGETEKKKTADLADKDTVFTYEGREIPPEDLEYMKRLLRGGKQ